MKILKMAVLLGTLSASSLFADNSKYYDGLVSCTTDTLTFKNAMGNYTIGVFTSKPGKSWITVEGTTCTAKSSTVKKASTLFYKCGTNKVVVVEYKCGEYMSYTGVQTINQ